MNFTGALIGIIAFVCIGVFHPIVIKAEYYFGKKVWPYFAVCGALLIVASLYVKGTVASAGLAVIGISALWSIGELFEQEQRVQKGWFPKNPNKQ